MALQTAINNSFIPYSKFFSTASSQTAGEGVNSQRSCAVLKLTIELKSSLRQRLDLAIHTAKNYLKAEQGKHHT